MMTNFSFETDVYCNTDPNIFDYLYYKIFKPKNKQNIEKYYEELMNIRQMIDNNNTEGFVNKIKEIADGATELDNILICIQLACPIKIGSNKVCVFDRKWENNKIEKLGKRVISKIILFDLGDKQLTNAPIFKIQNQYDFYTGGLIVKYNTNQYAFCNMEKGKIELNQFVIKF